MQSPSPSPSPASSTASNKISVFLATFFFSLLFLLSLSSTSSLYILSPSWSASLPPSGRADPSLFPSRRTISPNTPSDPAPPAIGYLISGSSGDSARILRLLFAAYHPRNYYLIHLDALAPQTDRDRLALTIHSIPIFKAAQNVNVFGNPDFAYSSGSSPISAALHGASVLLRLSDRWNWFLHLNAAHYPLVTQDDLLHILSFLPKDLNFVNHSSYIGWRESKKLKPIIVDPGLYLSDKAVMFFASQKRKLPNAFRMFSGSTSAILSRKVIEFCIHGTDNFPRTLLLYLANTPSSFSNYFPTVVCNSRQFNKTVVNHNLQYSIFDQPSKKEPRELSSNDFVDMIQSGAVFASQFRFNDPVLDRIDREILKRNPGKPVPGGWCLGESENNTCSSWGDADVLRPGPGATRLERLIVELLSDGAFRSRQCIIE